jgi:atypical dual specificity phosphatase
MPERFSWIIEGKIAGMERPGLFNDLTEDLEFLRDSGIDVIVSLQEEELFQDHGGFIVKNIPIDDFGAPELEVFGEFITYVTSHIDGGKGVLVHCYAGMGRTNLMLAGYLLHHLGMDPASALETVRSRRPVHVVNYRQQEALWDYFYTVRDVLPLIDNG